MKVGDQNVEIPLDTPERVLLAMVEGITISDHLGDVWNTVYDVARELGVELPDDGTDEFPGFEGVTRALLASKGPGE